MREYAKRWCYAFVIDFGSYVLLFWLTKNYAVSFVASCVIFLLVMWDYDLRDDRRVEERKKLRKGDENEKL